MNYKLFVIFLLGGVLVLAAYTLYHPEGETLAEAEPSSDSKRDYSYYLKQGGDFYYAGGAVAAWDYKNSSLFIADQNDQVIYRMDMNGTVTDTIGQAGVAPWENQQLRRFAVRGDEIASVDNSLMSLRVTNLSGNTKYYRKLNEPVWDGIFLRDGNFLLTNDDGDNFGFYKINAISGGKEELIRMNHILGIPNHSVMHIAYEGEMIQGINNHYYMCSRAGQIISFSDSGEYLAAFPTIDATGAPAIKEKKLNNMVVFERSPDEIVNYAGAADAQYLYVLSTIAFETTDQMSIDAYTPDGAYVFSMKVPNHRGSLPIQFLVHEDFMLVLYENQYVVTYEIRQHLL